MAFNTTFELGSVVSNSDIVQEFKCGNMGGMRRSKKTNTLVIISDHTKGLYEDKMWEGTSSKQSIRLYCIKNKVVYRQGGVSNEPIQ